MKDLNEMTPEEFAELEKKMSEERRVREAGERDAYEGLRHEFVDGVFDVLAYVKSTTESFIDSLRRDTAAFRDVMACYGRLKKSEQGNLTIVDGNRKLSVKSNKIKSFDERADMAAQRLIEYLKTYGAQSSKGTDDPMYQLAMTLLERNKAGDLDYKSISKLYELEGRFDDEYSEIMKLFRESNTVTNTVVNFYFFEKDANGVWQRIEPSFCRL